MGFAVNFLIMICVLAIIIIGIRWLLGLAGVAIPQPLMAILGIIAFLILLVWLVNYGGFNVGPFWHR